MLNINVNAIFDLKFKWYGCKDPDLMHCTSVADPDPGSGAFLLPGSGIQYRDGAMVGSGSGISKQNLLIAFIQTEVGSGIRCFFTARIRDPGWSNGRVRIRDKTSRIRNTALYSRFLLKETLKPPHEYVIRNKVDQTDGVS
jgi:hypothetical protein